MIGPALSGRTKSQKQRRKKKEERRRRRKGDVGYGMGLRVVTALFSFSFLIFSTFDFHASQNWPKLAGTAEISQNGPKFFPRWNKRLPVPVCDPVRDFPAIPAGTKRH